jgi:hypothetical protein
VLDNQPSGVHTSTIPTIGALVLKSLSLFLLSVTLR